MKKLIKFTCLNCGFIHYTDFFTDKRCINVNEDNVIIVCEKELDMWNCCI